MRLPAVRLPAWRPSMDWTEGLFSGRALWYGLYTLLLFGVFLFAHLPYRELAQRVLQSAQPEGMRIDLGDVRFAWWNGFELRDVRIAPADPSRPAFFESSSLYVRPALGELVRGELHTLDVSGVVYGGAVEGSVSTGELNHVTLQFDGVQPHRYPLLTSWLDGGQLAGRLSGMISIETRGRDINDVRAAGDLHLADAELVDAKFNAFPVAPLHFDGVAARFDLQGGRLEVQELKVDGKEILLDASGQVAMRSPLADSVLNLKLKLDPGPECPDDLKTLLSAIIPPPAKGAKPDSPRTLSGTLSKPRLR